MEAQKYFLMMIHKLSYLHLWEIIIPNYNKLGKIIPNHNTFWEIIPNYRQMTEVKPRSFDNGRKGFPPSLPVSNLNVPSTGG